MKKKAQKTKYEVFPDHMLAAVGRVTISFSKLDAAINWFVRAYLPLADLNEQAEVAEKLHSTASRIWLIDLIGRNRLKNKKREEFGKLIKEIYALNGERNKFMHHLWVISDKNESHAMLVPLKFSEDGGIIKRYLTVSEIDKLSDRIARAHAQLVFICVRRIRQSARSASANKSRSQGSQGS